MGGSSKSVDAGTWYYVALHDGLSFTPDAFLEWRVANNTAWSGALTASGAAPVNRPNLLGGEKDQGGIVGTLRVMFGEADQLPNTYLVSTFGAKTAAWRGFLTVAFEGGKYGANNPYAQRRSYRIRKIKKGWDDDTCWYPEKAEVPMISGFVTLLGDGWEYKVETFSEPNTGWNNFTVPTDGWVQGGELPFLDGTYWSPNRSNIWLRRRMYVSATGLTLNIGADNGCVVWVEGVNVGSSNPTNAPISSNQNNPVSYAFAATGEVEIIVKAFAEVNVEDEAGNVVNLTFTGTPLLAMNPAHMLYFLRTSRERGREPTANMGDANLRAAADYWYAKGFGLCGTRKAATVSPAEYEARICDILDCNFERSVTDGKFYINRTDGDYDLGSLPVLVDDDILSFKEIPTVLDNAVNSVAVKYFDTVQKKELTTPAIRALGMIAAFGENHQTYDYPEIPTAAMANEIALRKLLRSITPTRKFEFDCNTVPAEWQRFQYFRLQAPKRGIADMVCLVGSKVEGKLKSGGIQLSAVQDSASLDMASYVGVEHGVDTRPSQTPVAIVQQLVFEAPYSEVCTRLSRADLAALPDDVGFLVGVAADPASSRDFTMIVEPDGGEYSEAGDGDFCPTATVVEAAGRLDINFTLADGQLLDLVAVGEPVSWDDEICRVDAIDAGVGTITLGRACVDTVPQEHLAGSRLFFYSGAGASATTEFTDGELVHVKLLTNTSSDQLDPAVATEMGLTFDQRQARPYPPGDFAVAGDRWPVELHGSGVEITWAHRDRVGQADMLVDFTMASTGPEVGVTYTIENYNSLTDALVHSETGIVGTSFTLLPAHLTAHNRVELFSVRDGIESWQRHKAEFLFGIDITGQVFGGVNLETYSASFTAENAAEPVKWSLRGGSLPPGLGIIQDGSAVAEIGGVPNATTGYYSTTLRAIDANGLVAEKVLTIGIGDMVSLLHMDGANGQTTITDTVGAKAWTRGGNAALSTAAPKFGATASSHDGNGDYWTTPHHADFIPSDLQLRSWVRPSSTAGSGVFRGLISKRVSNTNLAWTLYQTESGGGYVFSVFVGTSASGASINLGPEAVGGYSFLTAAYKAGATGTLYGSSNGVAAAPVSGARATLYTGSSAVLLGVLGTSQNSSTQSFHGHQDEIAIIKGAVLYTEDHPVQTSASDYPQTPAALAVSGALPNGSAAIAYSSTTDIVIHGAGTPFSVTVSDGVLPGDWTAVVNADKVEVVGSGLAAGDYSFTLAIEDSATNTVELPLTVRIE